MTGPRHRLWGVCLAALLAGCASPTVPEPQAGALLDAPTTLNLGGRVVTLQADPEVQGDRLRVGLRLDAARPPLPGLNLTGVYVLGGSGVWKGPAPRVLKADCQEDGTTCLLAAASGAAGTLRGGADVQVVVQVRDRAGRTLWLRDAKVEITRAER